MVSLLDIAPTTEKVKVGETEIEVYGISAKGIAYLLGRFPELRALIAQVEVKPDALIGMAPDAIAAVICAGIGMVNKPEEEEAAARLPLEAQLDLLEAILRITMPKGIAPFVEKLQALGLVAGSADQSTKAQVTRSQKPSKA